MNSAEHVMSFLQVITTEDESAPAESNAVSAPTSNADEIRKFKALLDDGIITEEEFNAKKKQLLGI